MVNSVLGMLGARPMRYPCDDQLFRKYESEGKGLGSVVGIGNVVETKNDSDTERVGVRMQ